MKVEDYNDPIYYIYSRRKWKENGKKRKRKQCVVQARICMGPARKENCYSKHLIQFLPNLMLFDFFAIIQSFSLWGAFCFLFFPPQFRPNFINQCIFFLTKTLFKPSSLLFLSNFSSSSFNLQLLEEVEGKTRDSVVSIRDSLYFLHNPSKNSRSWSAAPPLLRQVHRRRPRSSLSVWRLEMAPWERPAFSFLTLATLFRLYGLVFF